MQKTSWGLVLALWGAGLGAAAQFGKFSAVFDQLPALYPDAGPALGFIVSAVGVSGMILGVCAGLVVARIRYRRALLLGLWIGAVISLFQALLPPLPWMLLSRGLEGLSHLVIVVAAPTLIAQICTPGDRGLALSLWGTFFGVAFSILAFAGLPLVARHGVPGLLVAHAIYMAACAILLHLRLKALETSTTPPALSLGKILRDHGEIYRSPRISAPAIGWLFYAFCFVSILTVLPRYLAPEVRGFVMGAMPLISIASSMTLGVLLLRYVSAVTVILIGFLGCALAVGWLFVAPGLPLACLTLAATMGLIQGASFASVPQLNTTAATQAQANGAMAQTGNIGNTLGTPVMALATGSLGYAGLPILAGAAYLLGAGAHIALARKRQQG